MGNIYSSHQNKYTTVDEPVTPVDKFIPSRETFREQQQQKQNQGKPKSGDSFLGANDSLTPIINEENYGGGETPVLIKSRHHIMALVDPRSPTQEISRTPISLEEQVSRREAAMSRLAKLKENSTPRNHNPNFLPTPNNTTTGFFDPRSPTEEIDRTPIRYCEKVPKRNL